MRIYERDARNNIVSNKTSSDLRILSTYSSDRLYIVWKEDTTITCKALGWERLLGRKIARRSKDSCRKDAREKKEKWKKRIEVGIREIGRCAGEIEKRRWSFNKERKGAWNKENDLREEEKRTERRANEYGRGVMGKVFRRPVTMRAYKYVNEVYYIPTRVSVRTIRRFLRRQAKNGSVRTCASTSSWTCYYTNQRDNQRAAPMCGRLSLVVFTCFFGFLFALLRAIPPSRPIGVSFYRGLSFRSQFTFLLPSLRDFPLQQIFKKLLNPQLSC